MKSSTGQYYIGLDHVRAVAAFIVFTWHFIHVHAGNLAGAPLYPLSILMEGHTGVALFMVLSGYLFAKLLDGKQIHYPAFLWNRFLRLAPLLGLVCLIVGVQWYMNGGRMLDYGRKLLFGLLTPDLPNGGWSITVEFHFYLLLPLLLALFRRWTYAPVGVVLLGLGARLLLHHHYGEVQQLAYWTIVGRIDQFALGMLAFQLRHRLIGRHVLVGIGLALFAAFYWYFDSLGGFYVNPSYPSPSRIWIVLPTVEGLAYGMGIAWYDGSFTHSTGRVSRFVAQIGALTYSLYLLHVFFVFKLAALVDHYLIDLSNHYVAMLISLPCFLLMLPIAYLSYRYVERPFMRFRRSYIVGRADAAGDGAQGASE